MSIPYIEASGTNREIGEAVGEHLRNDIEIALGRFEKHYQPTPALRTRRATLWATAKKYFPDYLEELQGLASGSGQPFDRLLSYSFEEELAYLESCSTVAVHTGHTILFGHNEDWDHLQPLYVLKAKPKKGPAFLSLGYAGQLPTTSVAMNEAGLVFSVNSVATTVNDRGLPKVFCLRGMLAARSLDEAMETLTQTDRATGSSSVMVFDHTLYMAEWSPTKIALETCNPWVAHANRFILPEMLGEQEQASRTSTAAGRLKQMWNWLVEHPIANVYDMKTLLSSHLNTPESLCRHGKQDITIASVVIDTAARRMEVAYGNPCTAPFQSFWL